MKFLMYGAGSIGRGFIGALFSQAGYDVVFIDIDTQIVERLNEKKSYRLAIAANPPYEQEILNVHAINGRDEEAVIREIADCDIMATSLGASVLERVAPIIAKGFARRMQDSGRTLDILICENLKNSADILREWLSSALPRSLHGELQSKLGLVETAIGRMVPVITPETQAEDPLRVCVEEYAFLPVDKAAFVGDIPQIDNLTPYAPFVFYEERKLYLHNMGHSACGYLGILRGYTYIYEAIEDPVIRVLVQSAMTESAAMLSEAYKIPFATIYTHTEDLLLRFENRTLGDTCERVIRDTMRKLAADDRLAGPLRKCWQMNIYPVYIALGLACALFNATVESSEAWRILKEICGLTKEQAEMIMELYEPLVSGADIGGLLQTAQRIKRRMRGQIV